MEKSTKSRQNGANTMLFISIHPEYVNAIIEGRKTVELRKRQPRSEVGSTVVIYATMPRCEVVATATLVGVESATPNSLWRKVKDDVAVTKSRFDLYYANSDTAVALYIADVSVFDSPIKLSDLRERWQGFHPPQQFQYLDSKQQRLISNQQSTLLALT